MKSKIEKILYDNLFVNILVTIFLTHIFYKISFINRIQGEFLLIEQIKSGSIDSTQFYVESPLFTLIGVLFDINNFDIYLLFVYLITLIFLFLITINLKFLENYSTLFLLTGWVVTVSWFMGHVDILSVLLILLITKITISKNNQELKLLFFYTLLTINHNAIAFVCFFVLLILVEKEQRIRFIIFSFLGQVFGNLLILYSLFRYFRAQILKKENKIKIEEISIILGIFVILFPLSTSGSLFHNKFSISLFTLIGLTHALKNSKKL